MAIHLGVGLDDLCRSLQTRMFCDFREKSVEMVNQSQTCQWAECESERLYSTYFHALTLDHNGLGRTVRWAGVQNIIYQLKTGWQSHKTPHVWFLCTLCFHSNPTHRWHFPATLFAEALHLLYPPTNPVTAFTPICPYISVPFIGLCQMQLLSRKDKDWIAVIPIQICAHNYTYQKFHFCECSLLF